MSQQVILRIRSNDWIGQRKLKRYQKKGYKIVSTTSLDGGWSPGKTVGLGLIFLPLALFGKRKPMMEYVLEKDNGQAEPTTAVQSE